MDILLLTIHLWAINKEIKIKIKGKSNNSKMDNKIKIYRKNRTNND